MTIPTTTPRALLTPGEVADMFRVDVKTVTRWAQAGQLASIRTVGGHRRFYADEVAALLGIVPAAAPDPAYPRATKKRALAGHTVTVEQLPMTGLAKLGVPVGTGGRLAVIERADGVYGTPRHVAEDGEPADVTEQVAVAAAGILGATYVAVTR